MGGGDSHRSLLVLFLVLTTLFGFAFLGIKAVEYHEKWEKHHIPGANFDVSDFVSPAAHGLHEKPLAPDMAQKTQIFFFLYFAMTGMHALHMVIGIGLLLWLIWRASRRRLHARLRRTHRELRTVLALRRYRLDLPLPLAVPDQSGFALDAKHST